MVAAAAKPKQKQTIQGAEGTFCTAKKPHRCDRYFRTPAQGCAGTGAIAAGERYWSPDADRHDAFHPYRVCAACVAAAAASPL